MTQAIINSKVTPQQLTDAEWRGIAGADPDPKLYQESLEYRKTYFQALVSHLYKQLNKKYGVVEKAISYKL